MIVKTLVRTNETIIEILDDLNTGDVQINIYTRVNPGTENLSYYSHSGKVQGVNTIYWRKSNIKKANDMVIDIKSKKKGGN